MYRFLFSSKEEKRISITVGAYILFGDKNFHQVCHVVLTASLIDMRKNN